MKHIHVSEKLKQNNEHAVIVASSYRYYYTDHSFILSLFPHIGDCKKNNILTQIMNTAHE